MVTHSGWLGGTELNDVIMAPGLIFCFWKSAHNIQEESILAPRLSSSCSLLSIASDKTVDESLGMRLREDITDVIVPVCLSTHRVCVCVFTLQFSSLQLTDQPLTLFSKGEVAPVPLIIVSPSILCAL